MSAEHVRRFNATHPCPICGGHDALHRGQGTRCHGFFSADGLYAHCSREEGAGDAPYHGASMTYSHRLNGPCKCGKEHGPAAPAPPADAPGSGRGRPEFDRTYDYRDEAGALGFQVVRFKNPKSFRQRRPDGRGGWLWNLQGADRLLYRLPELLAADPAAPILVAEGEKDVDRLRALGFIATCNPMGAGKWRDEFAARLKGRPVVILPDNDKVGRDHAEAVARSVHPLAASVQILALPEVPEHGDASDWLDRGGTAEQLARLIGQAARWEPTAPTPGDSERRNGNHGARPAANGKAAAPAHATRNGQRRPEIEISAARHVALAETMTALPADPELYRRGNVLVRVADDAEDGAEPVSVATRRANGLGRVVPLAEAGLSCRLTAVADYFTWRAGPKGEPTPGPAHPPPWLTRAVLEQGSYPGVRELRGVARCPFPRPDGTLATLPGYDAATGVYLAPGFDVGAVPDTATRDDARDAAEHLLAPVKQFPFASDNDRAVWLAGLLTVICRPAIDGPVPGVAMIGNRAGTGKGKLIDAIGQIAIGRPVPCTSYPEEREEAVKLKVSLALAATPVVNLDNLEEGQSYGRGALDSALTSLEVNDRILGCSKLTEGLELRCCWFLSGNNLVPAKDAYRRWLVCNLATELERPEERNDLEILDLLAHVRDRRVELVRAALVILRAHALAGRPTDGWAPLGSFEQWDRIVRGAVWYATGWDCNATRRQSAEESPERMNRLALLEAWAELPQGGPDGSGVTSERAHRYAVEEPQVHAELASVLCRLSRDGKVLSTRGIGNFIAGMKGRNIDGLAFQGCGYLHRSALWRVVRIDPRRTNPPQGRPEGNPGGESGESGESLPYPPHGERIHLSDMIVYETTSLGVEHGGESTPPTPQTPRARGVTTYKAPGFEDLPF